MGNTVNKVAGVAASSIFDAEHQDTFVEAYNKACEATVKAYENDLKNLKTGRRIEAIEFGLLIAAFISGPIIWDKLYTCAEKRAAKKAEKKAAKLAKKEVKKNKDDQPEEVTEE